VVLRVAVCVGLSLGLGCFLPLSGFAETKSPVTKNEASVAGRVNPIDQRLAEENAGVKLKPTPVINDLAFLRRITIDLIGRIPTSEEIVEYQSWPSNERRARATDKLFADGRFADRWTVFYADMLRLRTNAEGGQAFLAFVHQAVEAQMPYDEMVRQLLAANGKANYTPEVGFILGDAADPMAMAGVTSQTFLGIRIACAQCHDHPFDVWKREDFYGLAAYFGKTRRIENQFTRTIYTTEMDQTTILWPPEGVGKEADRKPMKPSFPFKMEASQEIPEYIQRLNAVRAEQHQKKLAAAQKAPTDNVDSLLADADSALEQATVKKAGDATGVLDENQREVNKLALARGKYASSELRTDLGKLITNPRNRYFSRNLVNRVWAELIGRGFVDPVDDFSDNNKPSHPKTLDFLADEFVASGYDLKTLVRLIVTSETYQRDHLTGVDEQTRTATETAFLATPMRRMISEVLYDSIVVGGHLFDVKHEGGKNLTTVWRHQQLVKEKKSTEIAATNLAAAVKSTGAGEAAIPAGGKPVMAAKPGMAAPTAATGANSGGYSLEDAIELDFNAVLSKKDDEPTVEAMAVMSKEEIEAQMMSKQIGRPGVEYIDKFVRVVFDDNPKFTTAMRMETPAPPTHFLRVFGQSTRESLGEFRDHNPTMRQALLIMNGRLTHEASRVGELEPAYKLLVGKKPDHAKAVGLAYRNLLTREATPTEIQEGIEIIKAGSSVLDGYADLRWLLLNCNEFRFIP
jgi:hypothetical protein